MGPIASRGASKGKWSQESRRHERKTTLLRAQAEEGPPGPRDAAASRSWKRPGIGFGAGPVTTWMSAQGHPGQTPDLQNCERIRLCCFKPLKLWAFVAAATGDSYQLPKSSVLNWGDSVPRGHLAAPGDICGFVTRVLPLVFGVDAGMGLDTYDAQEPPPPEIYLAANVSDAEVGKPYLPRGGGHRDGAPTRH